MLLDPEKQARQAKILTDITKEYSAFSDTCKRMAAARRELSPVRQENILTVLENIQSYIDETRKQGRPLTHAGFARCFGVSCDTYYALDKYDYVTDEYRQLNNLPVDATEHQTENGTIPLITYSEIKKKVCDVAIQEQLEENCYTNRGNPAGSIFGLKARYDWKEDGTPQKLVQNLVIADAEKAKEALKMLE